MLPSKELWVVGARPTDRLRVVSFVEPGSPATLKCIAFIQPLQILS